MLTRVSVWQGLGAGRGRVARRVGRRGPAGRPPIEQRDPTLRADLEALIEPTTRSDPESPLRWTTRSVRNLAAELRRQGEVLSPPVLVRCGWPRQHLCDEIVDELVETIMAHARWTKAQILETYGPVLRSAVVVTPVDETETHRRFVDNDLDDTLFIRVAEAIVTQAPHILEADGLRLIVSENTNQFRPGPNYASFRRGTAHDALLRLEAA